MPNIDTTKLHRCPFCESRNDPSYNPNTEKVSCQTCGATAPLSAWKLLAGNDRFANFKIGECDKIATIMAPHKAIDENLSDTVRRVEAMAQNYLANYRAGRITPAPVMIEAEVVTGEPLKLGS